MKFYSKPISEHAEVPIADEGRLEEFFLNWEKRETLHDKQNSGHMIAMSFLWEQAKIYRAECLK